MRNLLSQQDEKIIMKEYKFRVIIVAFVFLLFTIPIAGTMLLPSYILSVYKYNTIKNNNAIIQEFVNKREQSELSAVLNMAQEKLKFLSVAEDSNLLSGVIRKIVENRPSGIKLGKLIYTKKQNNNEIFISGIAKNRETLLIFKRELGKEEKFFDVVLPISDLASDRDIEFSIRIMGEF